MLNLDSRLLHGSEGAFLTLKLTVSLKERYILEVGSLKLILFMSFEQEVIVENFRFPKYWSSKEFSGYWRSCRSEQFSASAGDETMS